MLYRITAAIGFSVALAGPALTQPVPTSQPAIIDIAREVEKPGHFAAHEQTEIRWANLNRRSGFPATSLALVAVSGTPEVWWVSSFSGLGAFGKASTFGGDVPGYNLALGRIAAEDGEHVTNVIRMQAAAVPEASHGPFPEIGKMRVFSILTVQMRQGMEPAFTEIAKRYASIMRAKGVAASWRAYSVLSGAPSGTFLVFSSFPSWDAVEADQKATDAAMAGAAATELEGLMKAAREAVTSTNLRYFNVNPRMSLVSKELMAADPFWAVKSTP